MTRIHDLKAMFKTALEPHGLIKPEYIQRLELRVKEIQGLWGGDVPSDEAISTVFIESGKDKGDVGGVWFLSKNRLIATFDFSPEADHEIQIHRLKNNIASLSVKADHAMGEPNFGSYLTVELRLRGEEKSLTLKARADNCMLLGEVVRKYLVPNLKT